MFSFLRLFRRRTNPIPAPSSTEQQHEIALQPILPSSPPAQHRKTPKRTETISFSSASSPDPVRHVRSRTRPLHLLSDSPREAADFVPAESSGRREQEAESSKHRDSHTLLSPLAVQSPSHRRHHASAKLHHPQPRRPLFPVDGHAADTFHLPIKEDSSARYQAKPPRGLKLDIGGSPNLGEVKQRKRRREGDGEDEDRRYMSRTKVLPSEVGLGENIHSEEHVLRRLPSPPLQLVEQENPTRYQRHDDAASTPRYRPYAYSDHATSAPKAASKPREAFGSAERQPMTPVRLTPQQQADETDPSPESQAVLTPKQSVLIRRDSALQYDESHVQAETSVDEQWDICPGDALPDQASRGNPGNRTEAKAANLETSSSSLHRAITQSSEPSRRTRREPVDVTRNAAPTKKGSKRKRHVGLEKSSAVEEHCGTRSPLHLSGPADAHFASRPDRDLPTSLFKRRRFAGEATQLKGDLRVRETSVDPLCETGKEDEKVFLSGDGKVWQDGVALADQAGGAADAGRREELVRKGRVAFQARYGRNEAGEPRSSEPELSSAGDNDTLQADTAHPSPPSSASGTSVHNTHPRSGFSFSSIDFSSFRDKHLSTAARRQFEEHQLADQRRAEIRASLVLTHPPGEAPISQVEYAWRWRRLHKTYYLSSAVARSLDSNRHILPRIFEDDHEMQDAMRDRVMVVARRRWTPILSGTFMSKRSERDFELKILHDEWSLNKDVPIPTAFFPPCSNRKVQLGPMRWHQNRLSDLELLRGQSHSRELQVMRDWQALVGHDIEGRISKEDGQTIVKIKGGGKRWEKDIKLARDRGERRRELKAWERREEAIRCRRKREYGDRWPLKGIEQTSGLEMAILPHVPQEMEAPVPQRTASLAVTPAETHGPSPPAQPSDTHPSSSPTPPASSPKPRLERASASYDPTSASAGPSGVSDAVKRELRKDRLRERRRKVSPKGKEKCPPDWGEEQTGDEEDRVEIATARESSPIMPVVQGSPMEAPSALGEEQVDVQHVKPTDDIPWSLDPAVLALLQQTVATAKALTAVTISSLPPRNHLAVPSDRTSSPLARLSAQSASPCELGSGSDSVPFVPPQMTSETIETSGRPPGSSSYTETNSPPIVDSDTEHTPSHAPVEPHVSHRRFSAAESFEAPEAAIDHSSTWLGQHEHEEEGQGEGQRLAKKRTVDQRDTPEASKPAAPSSSLAAFLARLPKQAPIILSGPEQYAAAVANYTRRPNHSSHGLDGIAGHAPTPSGLNASEIAREEEQSSPSVVQATAYADLRHSAPPSTPGPRTTPSTIRARPIPLAPSGYNIYDPSKDPRTRHAAPSTPPASVPPPRPSFVPDNTPFSFSFGRAGILGGPPQAKPAVLKTAAQDANASGSLRSRRGPLGSRTTPRKPRETTMQTMLERAMVSDPPSDQVHVDMEVEDVGNGGRAEEDMETSEAPAVAVPPPIRNEPKIPFYRWQPSGPSLDASRGATLAPAPFIQAPLPLPPPALPAEHPWQRFSLFQQNWNPPVPPMYTASQEPYTPVQADPDRSQVSRTVDLDMTGEEQHISASNTWDRPADLDTSPAEHDAEMGEADQADDEMDEEVGTDALDGPVMHGINRPLTSLEPARDSSTEAPECHANALGLSSTDIYSTPFPSLSEGANAFHRLGYHPPSPPRPRRSLSPVTPSYPQPPPPPPTRLQDRHSPSPIHPPRGRPQSPPRGRSQSPPRRRRRRSPSPLTPPGSPETPPPPSPAYTYDSDGRIVVSENVRSKWQEVKERRKRLRKTPPRPTHDEHGRRIPDPDSPPPFPWEVAEIEKANAKRGEEAHSAKLKEEAEAAKHKEQQAATSGGGGAQGGVAGSPVEQSRISHSPHHAQWREDRRGETGPNLLAGEASRQIVDPDAEPSIVMPHEDLGIDLGRMVLIRQNNEGTTKKETREDGAAGGSSARTTVGRDKGKRKASATTTSPVGTASTLDQPWVQHLRDAVPHIPSPQSSSYRANTPSLPVDPSAYPSVEPMVPVADRLAALQISANDVSALRSRQTVEHALPPVSDLLSSATEKRSPSWNSQSPDIVPGTAEWKPRKAILGLHSPPGEESASSPPNGAIDGISPRLHTPIGGSTRITGTAQEPPLLPSNIGENGLLASAGPESDQDVSALVALHRANPDLIALPDSPDTWQRTPDPPIDPAMPDGPAPDPIDDPEGRPGHAR